MLLARRWRAFRPLLGIGLIPGTCVTAVPALDAGAGRAIVRSFGPPEAHAKGPVLSFAETADECLFLGSNHLVGFDGYRWQQIDAPGAYAFRALAAGTAGSPQVWVASAGELGWADRDGAGNWRYHSLLPQLRAAGVPSPGEIGFAAAIPGGAIFTGHRRILRWNGARFEVWTLDNPGELRATEDRPGAIWIVQPGGGLWHLGAKGPPKLVRGADALPGGGCRWVLPPRSGEADREKGVGLLVGIGDAAYRVTAGPPRRLETLSAALAGKGPVAAVTVEDNEIAVGTRRGGVIFATRDDRLVAIVDRSDGLDDDAVFALWSDRRGGVWAGLEGACARLDRVGFASLFTAREGLTEGLPRKVTPEYILTDKTLYRQPPAAPTARLAALLHAPGTFTDAVPVGSDLWIAGSDGLWRVAGTRAELAIPLARPVLRVAALPNHTGLVYADAEGLVLVRPDGTRSAAVPLPSHPLGLAMGPDNPLWALTADGAIRRFSLSPPNSPPAMTPTGVYRVGQGQTAPFTPTGLTVLGTELIVFGENGVARWSGATFEPLPNFAGWALFLSAPRSLPSGLAGAYWVGRKTSLSDAAPVDILRVTAAGGGRINWQPLRAPGVDDLGDVTSIDTVPGADGEEELWVGGKGGLLRLRMRGVGPLSANREVRLRQVETADRAGLPLRPADAPDVGVAPATVTFGFCAAQPMEVEPVGVFYQTRLEGAEAAWGPADHKTSRSYIGLAPGHYVFNVRRLDRYGRPGGILVYPFVVLAPWFERWPAWLACGMILAAAVAAVFRWRIHRLRSQAARLERLVARRTRELELSNTAKNEFLESISHEIRNPLNGIVGLADMLDRAPLPPPERDVARSLKDTAQRLRRVAEDVLGQSAWEFGAFALNQRTFEVRRLLNELAADHAAAASQAGCGLAVRLPEGEGANTGLMVGDEGKIRTLLGNFLANAIKYAPGRAIELQADWTEEANGAVQFYAAVTDHGPGIPVEEQELVFQKFVRGSSARAAMTPGAGVGLATCRTLARRMGGSVGVESPVFPAAAGAPAHGSSFHLWLPLHRPPPRKPSAERTPPTGTALIVDDEPYNRTVLEGLVKELGFSSVVADNGPAALQLAADPRVSVVFLDLELPGMKGTETATRLRAAHGTQDLLLIATTGHDSEDARRRCREAGMDAFLLKPIDLGLLQEALRRAGEAAPKPAAKPEALPPSRQTQRSIRLYAEAAGISVPLAESRLHEAISQELKALEAALLPLNREALRQAAHRLRTLGALAQTPALNAAAARLQDLAPANDLAELRALVEAARRTAASLLRPPPKDEAG